MTRVLFFLPDLAGGGAERVTLSLCQGLIERGMDCSLVLASKNGPLLTSLPPSVEILDLGCSGTFSAFPALRRAMKEMRPQVVVSGLAHANVVAVTAARLLSPRPRCIVVQHNTMSREAGTSRSIQDRSLPALCAVTYRLADRILAVSEGVADDLSEYLRIDRSRVEAMPNPVDYSTIEHLRGAALDRSALPPGDGPLICTAGRLVAQKDHDTLLTAFSLLPAEFRLLVLGDGELRPRLMSRARELAITERVSMPGFVDNPYPFLDRADVFALSSRFEGLPTVLLEALYFRAAIVSTDCPSGPREILDSGNLGFLCRVADPQELANAIVDATASGPRHGPEAHLRYEMGAVVDQFAEVLEAESSRLRS